MDVKMSGADEHAIMQPRVDLPGFQNFQTSCRQPQDDIRGPETQSLGSHATEYSATDWRREWNSQVDWIAMSNLEDVEGVERKGKERKGMGEAGSSWSVDGSTRPSMAETWDDAIERCILRFHLWETL